MVRGADRVSPQIARNTAARALFAELGRRYPDLDRAWLRRQINEIVAEELRLVDRDLLAEVRRGRHFHGAMSGTLEDELITVRKARAAIQRRLVGEHS
jgi:hypothetical protein